MAQEVSIAAVGDILMKRPLIQSAEVQGSYSFDSMFKTIAPYLRAADLTIGNLETTFSGRAARYERINPKTGYPLFNCPDELADTLKRTGFDVLTTANNHCMDGGVTGLLRTIKVLERNRLLHTGTFATEADSKRFLIQTVKGIRIGILAYTRGTNSIPVPKDQSWLVNKIQQQKMIQDLKRLKPQVDLVIVNLHFGREYQQFPAPQQINLVKALFQQGADIVLGCHPHVLQPMVLTPQHKFVIFSLGNFISSRLRRNPFSLNGVLLQLKVQKKDSGKTGVIEVSYIPTWVHQSGSKFEVLPIPKTLAYGNESIPKSTQEQMEKMWRHTKSILQQKISL